MFGPRLTILRLFGFPIRIDVSWIFIAVLITWSLAAHLFPSRFPDLDAATYWIMGVVGALGLFASIVLHELGHALMARRYGMEMGGITLFIFGGVAEMRDEPPHATAELMVAIAGPLVSVALSVTLMGAGMVGETMGLGAEAAYVLKYLGLINGLLVVFNMIPAFPLDGGRVLRSILWASRNDLRWATRVTSRLGAGFGLFLIALGALHLFAGSFVLALWWFMLGLFLRSAAGMSYQQLLVRQALEGEPVHRFMTREVVSVPPDISLEELVERYVYTTHHKLFPVLDGDRLEGCVSTREVKDTPREEWSGRMVRDVMRSCGRDNTVDPEDDAMRVLARLSESQTSRVLVVRDGRLEGMLSLKDLMEFLRLKIELEDR